MSQNQRVYIVDSVCVRGSEEIMTDSAITLFAVPDTQLKRFPNHAMMSRQTQLALSCVDQLLAGYAELYQDRRDFALYTGVSQNHFDERILKVLYKQCYNNQTHTMDWSLLGDVINKLPPLDGVKLLPTAILNFIAQYHAIKTEGYVTHLGELSGLMALYQAYNQIAAGEKAAALVVATESNLKAHELFYTNLFHPADHDADRTDYYESASCFLLANQAYVAHYGKRPIAELIQVQSGYGMDAIPSAMPFNSGANTGLLALHYLLTQTESSQCTLIQKTTSGFGCQINWLRGSCDV